MIEIMVGVHIVDFSGYDLYRENMLPILRSYGGAFSVDVQVSAVLSPKNTDTINRLFTIRFPSFEKLDGFFADDEYQNVRAQFFVPSVSTVEELGCYTVKHRYASPERLLD